MRTDSSKRDSNRARQLPGAATAHRGALLLLVMALAVLAWGAPLGPRPAWAQQADAEPESTGSEGVAAQRLLRSAEQLLDAGEHERAVRMLESLIRQYPASFIRHQALLAVGRHYAESHQYDQAVNHLRQLRDLRQGNEQLTGDRLDVYLEGMYLVGVSYFQMQQYGSAFPVLRRITREYPNSVWSNQAYYYIGMCHFAQGNWSKAIESLSLVGTFVDASAQTVQYIEAGRRFYVKVADADLPVLYRLGDQVQVALQTTSGDRETIDLMPLSGEGEFFIGSISTALGHATPGDQVLQVLGGDTVSAHYVDRNTRGGEAQVDRLSEVRVVSTASLLFTRGDYEAQVEAAYLGSPAFLVLHDADQDRSDTADAITVRMVSRYRQDAEQASVQELGRSLDIEQFLAAQDEQYQVRDTLTVTLTELGDAPVRSGRFGGRVPLVRLDAGQEPDLTDDVLHSEVGDEIVVSYIDELHIQGDSPRQVTASVPVVSEVTNRPEVSSFEVADPALRARKDLVEAEAFLELARIFKSMGLNDGAAEKSNEGLTRVDQVIRADAAGEAVPAQQTEQAYQLKWQLQLAQDDLEAAIRTCHIFNRLYPDSPLVDAALLGIGMIKLERGEHGGAITVFRQILALPNSQVKAEAQFHIAEATEASQPIGSDAAIEQYKRLAQTYPDSEYAGRALGKLVDYYIDQEDYAAASDLLEQVFMDHPDAKFLDNMLLKWVVVSYRMGNACLALEKAKQLLFEYPGSSYAERARQILPTLDGACGGAE